LPFELRFTLSYRDVEELLAEMLVHKPACGRISPFFMGSGGAAGHRHAEAGHEVDHRRRL
jgi:hypothetical protein